MTGTVSRDFDNADFLWLRDNDFAVSDGSVDRIGKKSPFVPHRNSERLTAVARSGGNRTKHINRPKKRRADHEPRI